MKKRSKTVQIRISDEDRKMINAIYDNIDEFNLSSFIRKCLYDLCDKYGISPNKKGIGFLKIGE